MAVSCLIGTTWDDGFDKIIIYARNVIIRTHGDYFSQTKAASGLKWSIGCLEIYFLRVLGSKGKSKKAHGVELP